MADWNEWIMQLLARTDIVGLVSKYVRLTKKGASHWACCPFHHEKTPSFSVSESRQVFHCFGCGVGGNAISFVSMIESVDRMDAIKMLAEANGMELPHGEMQSNYDREEARKKRIRLLSLLKDCARHYNENLKLDRARIAGEYLAKRGIDQKLIARFGLGYSLGFEEAVVHLEQKGYTKAEIKEAGVAAQKADRYYDVFAGRLMIPIIDITGSVTGFGGRLLTNEDFAKYRNSTQTPVFDKSKNLFAVNLVKKKKQKEGLKYLIVTEGYMDVIALHKAGFDTAVASMGTSLTPEQAKIIKNLCQNVYISYDGDAAGQKATLRGLDILCAAGLNVRVVTLPDKLDPDDVINQKGAPFYARLMQKALPLTAFKLETLKKNHDLSTPEGKSGYAVEAVAVIKRLDNPVEREEYLKTVHQTTGYSMRVLYKQADLPEPDSPPTPVKIFNTAEKTGKGERGDELKSLDTAKEFVLSELAMAKPYANLSEDLYSLMEDEGYQRILGVILQAIKRPDYSPAQLYMMAAEQDEEMVTALVSYETVAGDGAEKYIGCIKRLKLNLIDKQISQLLESYRQTKDASLLDILKDLQIKAHELKK